MSSRDHLDLLEIVRQVRRRWRMKIALRGATTVLGLGALLLLAAAFGLQYVRFAPVFIIGARVALGIAFLLVAGLFLVRPLMRRVSDEQVALYLEEHEPRLESAIISAVEHAKAQGTGSTLISDDSRSPALIARLVESAIEKCAETRAPRQVEKKVLARYAVLAAGVVALALVIFGVGPNYLRQAISALLSLASDLQAAAPYKIAVSPGDATIPKGADQSIVATLTGFSTPDAALYVRTAADAKFEKMPLIPADNGSFDAMLFDVSAETVYYVEAEGVQSRHFTLTVVDLPYVQSLKLEYRFPRYTGMEPEIVEHGGDIAVIGGTQILAQITPTMKTPGGRIIVNDTQQVPLKVAADGTLSGAFVAAVDGFYRVELDAPTGERVAASPQYTIDVLSDQTPRVSFSKPGRDTTATSIEEVYVEAHAQDDFGVRNLELVYAVNGGAEKTVNLFGGARRLTDVSAGHTFYLEELGVKPGDSVSYYARAADNSVARDSGGANQQTSDIYFLRVRPFKKDFRAAQSMAGGGGGGGGGMNEVNALSEQQRQIISATFNIQRDRKALSASQLTEKTVVVGLSQSRLREQVEGLVARMTSRFLQPDPSFKKIQELLPKAIAEMKLAEAQLGQAKPEGALPPENRALQYLQTAEEEYETQITMNRGGGGGGGGGSQVARELAEIFEMDLDKLANQYETADRAMQQSADQQVDELMEKLKELARRQEQEAEQQRRRALQSMGNAQSGGAQQRALADQAEEMARRLERLSRERPELGDLARQMRDVADSMRRAAAGGQQGTAQASQALDRLKEAQRRLQRSQADRTRRDIEDAQRQVEEIARDQKAIGSDVSGLQSRQGDARRQAASDINARKGTLDSKLAELEKQLDRGAADASAEEKDAAKKMSEAAGAIRDSRLRDKLRYSRGMVGRANRDTMDVIERDIADSIDAVRRKVDQAAAALGTGSTGTPGEKETTVDRAQRLARGMESLEERMRERLERGAGQRADQQNQQGAQSGQAQRGQQSQQGQQGRAGQQGRQGQGQQGQGQQGQGQQSQGQQSQGQQSQGQQSQGQQGQSGQGGDGQGGDGGTFGGDVGRGTFGDPRAGYGWGGWDGYWRGYLSPDDIRQFRGEARQWVTEGADLRRRLLAENLDPKELDDILRRLRQLDDDRVYKDAAELQRLQQSVTEGLKRFEYSLRRQTEEKDKEVVLSGSDEVPDAFRPLVEQYYRSLSKGASR